MSFQAVKDGEVVATGKTAAEALEKAQEKGYKEVTIKHEWPPRI